MKQDYEDGKYVIFSSERNISKFTVSPITSLLTTLATIFVGRMFFKDWSQGRQLQALKEDLLDRDESDTSVEDVPDDLVFNQQEIGSKRKTLKILMSFAIMIGWGQIFDKMNESMKNIIRIDLV